MDHDRSSELPNRSNELFIIQLVFLIIAGICTLIRAYIKIFLVKCVTTDDYLILSAMIGYTAYGAISLDGVQNGATGKPSSQINGPHEAARSLRAWYLCEVLYAPVTLTIRASVCILLLRMATRRSYRWIIWVNLGVGTIVSTAFFFILVFQCKPVSYFWNQVYGEKGYCVDKDVIPVAVVVHSILSALSDWCLGLLPVALLWNVKINRRTKVTIVILLSLGMIGGIALIVRIPYITHLKPSIEFLYVSVDVAIWSVMEPALGITAACIATFRPLFKHSGFGWASDHSDPTEMGEPSQAMNCGRTKSQDARGGEGDICIPLNTLQQVYSVNDLNGSEHEMYRVD
ncbi:hypothetical protein EDB80DRAFT_628547 [Ilyonectria destructans]|nr:hypothetical protein EDB80DRAFT_628547 [Ilyonectria destructans]